MTPTRSAPDPSKRMSNAPARGTPWTWRLGLIAAVAALTTLAYLGQDFLGRRGQAIIGVFSIGLIAWTVRRSLRA